MIGMVIKQLKRSALRRALQSSFFESILAMLEHAPKRGKLETRYEVTWKWALTLCALMQQGVSESGKLGTIRKKAVETVENLKLPGGGRKLKIAIPSNDQTIEKLF